jgi:hypothetical protein
MAFLIGAMALEGSSSPWLCEKVDIFTLPRERL